MYIVSSKAQETSRKRKERHQRKWDTGRRPAKYYLQMRVIANMTLEQLCLPVLDLHQTACQQPIRDQRCTHGTLPLTAELLITDGFWEKQPLSSVVHPILILPHFTEFSSKPVAIQIVLIKTKGSQNKIRQKYGKEICKEEGRMTGQEGGKRG